MKESAKHMVSRIETAKSHFSEIVMHIAACSEGHAQMVTDYYLANKIAKLDPVNGIIRVQHGVFLEADVILDAIEQSKL